LKKISAKKIEKHCDEVSKCLKLISHKRRLLILSHLAENERSVNELAELCHISQPQTSHFLAKLGTDGMIACEKVGQKRMYSIVDERLKIILKTIQEQYCRK
jgi:ArsR family transcriptional regulator, virulence genes transcriptional regulator